MGVESDDALGRRRATTVHPSGSAVINGCADPLRRPHRPLLPLVILRTAAQTVLIFAWGIVAVAGLLLSAVVRPLSHRAAYDMNSAIAGSLWTYMQHAFERMNGAQITFSGHAIPRGENAIVIANHVGYLDFALLQAVALRRGMIGRCRYFAKFELIWQIPVFGLAMWLMDMVMLKRNWLRDRHSVEAAFNSFRRDRKPVWLISYLEGHRATPKRVAASQRFAAEHERPVLKHVLLPRTKGFVATVQALRGSHVKHVYDFTLVFADRHGHVQGAPPMWVAYGFGRLSPTYRFHSHVERFALEDLPESDEALAAWVDERWRKKDALLADMSQRWLAADGLTVKDADGHERGVYTEPL